MNLATFIQKRERSGKVTFGERLKVIEHTLNSMIERDICLPPVSLHKSFCAIISAIRENIQILLLVEKILSEIDNEDDFTIYGVLIGLRTDTNDQIWHDLTEELWLLLH